MMQKYEQSDHSDNDFYYDDFLCWRVQRKRNYTLYFEIDARIRGFPARLGEFSAGFRVQMTTNSVFCQNIAEEI